MNSALPTGTVTFLYTDIEGSAALWERDPAAMHEALDLHNALLHEALAHYGGCVYKIIGDAFQVAFADPLPALGAALAAQRGLAAATWGRVGPLKVRMGLHRGRAVAEEADYDTTHTLNRVARIMAAGHGGQILLSQAVVEALTSGLPQEITLRDLGKHRMKGLTQLEHLFQVLAPDLPAEFPPLKTLDIAPNNMPHQLTSFIGRAQELDRIQEVLRTARLVTLVGTGGCGKTRLALEAGATLQDRFPHGVWFVELAPLSDPAHIVETIANTLPLPEQRRIDPYQAVLDFLREREVLLLLDNCEHLIEASARLAESLLHACPKLRILASSREALGIGGEVPLVVPSLSMADPDALPSLESLREVESVQLFVERAALLRPDFVLDETTGLVVARICRRLDGIPLAIELAAARIRVLAVEQILERLEDRFRLLTGGSRTALPRQQTLRATIDWSYQLLTAPEQQLLRRLSVFNGGWTLEAAEAVGAGPGDGIEAYEVLDLLTHLVDKSLITIEEFDDQVRYRRLESIRLYARERFLESAEVATIRDRHLAWCVGWAERSTFEFSGQHWRERRAEAARELENVRGALAWALDKGDAASALRIAVALASVWDTGRQEEGRRWLEEGLQQREQLPATLLSDGLRLVGWLAARLNDYETAIDRLEDGLSVAGEAGDQRRVARCLMRLASVYSWNGAFDTAHDHLLNARRICESLGDERGIAGVLDVLGGHYLLQRDFARSLQSCTEGLAIAHRLGDQPLVGHFCNGAGFAHVNLGNLVEAKALFHQGLRDGGQLVHSFLGLAMVAAAENEYVRAAHLIGMLDALQAAPVQHALPTGATAIGAAISRIIDGIQARGDAAVFAAARLEGRKQPLEQAMAYALEDIEL